MHYPLPIASHPWVLLVSTLDFAVYDAFAGIRQCCRGSESFKFLHISKHATNSIHRIVCFFCCVHLILNVKFWILYVRAKRYHSVAYGCSKRRALFFPSSDNHQLSSLSAMPQNSQHGMTRTAKGKVRVWRNPVVAAVGAQQCAWQRVSFAYKI